MKKSLLVIILVLLFGQARTQTAELDWVAANPGDTLLMPVIFSDLVNTGAISIFISYDTNVITFDGITNIDPNAAGTLANALTNPPRVGISWLALTGGVDFDGKFLDMRFIFHGDTCSLNFTDECEIVDWDVNVINVNYTGGFVSSLVGEEEIAKMPVNISVINESLILDSGTEIIENVDLLVYDINGRKVFSTRLAVIIGREVIKTSLDRGAYVIVLNDGLSSTSVKVLVK